jgi:AcrR family transcriptional regulator
VNASNESRAVVQRRGKISAARVGRPRKLTAEAIVQAALEIIDEHGMDKLSLRSLANRLDVQANAIYTHYDNLEAINEAIVEQLLLDIPSPDAASTTPLREQLIEHFVALRAAFLRHPRVTTGRVGSPAWIRNARQLDNVLAQLVSRKVDIAAAEVAYSALAGVALMNAAQENAVRDEDAPGNRRKAAAAVKAIDARHVIAMMNLPRFKLPAEARFRQLLGSLIDQLLPASVAKGGKGKLTDRSSRESL